MRRLSLLPLAVTLVLATAVAPPAVARERGRCVAVSPGLPSCSYLSAGGGAQVSCYLADRCYAYIGGFGTYLPSGTTVQAGTSTDDVVGVIVYGTGLAIATDA